MIQLKQTLTFLPIFAIALQIAQGSKCNLNGGHLVCTDVNDDELLENIKQYQPTHLTCNECTISKLHLQQANIETRRKLQEIEIIELLNELDLDLNTFTGVENLHTLTFMNTTLKSFEADLLKPLTKLTEVNFHNCDVRQRVRNCFKYTPQLRKFALTKTSVYALRAQWFEDTPNLVELNFTDDKIHTLDKDTFKALPKLEKIILHNNNITALPLDLFDQQIDLKYLDISRNPIRVIDIKHIIETNQKMDAFLIHDLPCPVFESNVDSLNTLQFVTECIDETGQAPFEYKTACVKLQAYDNRKPSEKLIVFETNDGHSVASDDNFHGIPCVSNKNVLEVFPQRP